MRRLGSALFFIVPPLKDGLSNALSNCNNFFFFLVKWNFVGRGEKHLSLEIGDMVYIQEACDGKNISKHKNDTIILKLT